MVNKDRTRLSKRMKWGLWSLVAAVLIYTVTGFFLLPALMKHLLLKNLKEITQREVSIHGVKTNPFKFTVRLEGFSITSKRSQEKLASCKEIFINIESPSVIRWAFIVDEIKIVEPSMRLVRDKDNRFNVSDILEQWSSKGEKAGNLLIPRLSLERIQIVNGRFEFIDELEEERHLVEEIQLDIPLISNLEKAGGGWVEPHLSAKINGAPLTVDGKVSPFSASRRTLLALDIKEMGAANYLTYLPDEWNLKVLSGVLSFQTKLAFSRKKKDKFAFKLTGVLSLKDLEATDRDDNELLKISNLKINVASVDPMSRRLHLSNVSGGPFEIHVKRDASGKINLGSLATGQGPGDKSSKKTEGERPFRFQIDEINLEHGTTYFTDRTLGEPFSTHLEISALNVRGLRNDMDNGATLRLAGKTGFGEEVSLKGRFGINPLSSEGEFEIKNIPAEKYEPYYRQHISFDTGSPMINVGASYSFSGAETDPSIQLSNAWASLRALRVKPGDGSREIADIPVLDIKGGQVNLKKREVIIREVNASRGHLFLSREEQGALNLQKLFQPKALEPESIPGEKSQTPDEGWSLKLEKVTFEGFSLEAEDRMGEAAFLLGLKKADLLLEGVQTKIGASEPDLQFSGMKVSLGSLKLGRAGDSENMVDIPLLVLNGADFRLQERRFKVLEVTSEGGQVNITRFESGKLNLESILPVSTSHKVKASDKGNGLPETGRGWEVTLGKGQFKGFKVKAEDRDPAKPLSMEFQDINLEVQNLSNQEGSRGRLLLDCEIKEKGFVKLDGSIGGNPLFADLNVDLKGLGLSLAQPYIPAGVKVGLARGKLSANGGFLLKEKESREGWNVDFKGDAVLSEFSAIDTVEGKELLRSKALSLTDIHWGNEPAQLSIKRTNMEQFRILTEVGPDGVFNIFRAIFEKKRNTPTAQATPGGPDKAGVPGKGSSPFKVAIDEMIFQDGSIHFSDKFIKPNFEAKVLDIGGRIDHLSSEAGVLAQIALQGNMGGSAPVKIAGKSNPLGKDVNLEMDILFQDIEMTRMNTYARKYLGYNIEKGKLSLDLRYNIVKDKMKLQNKILIQGFRLGERVESPSVLIVNLEETIPLLQDREGNISLNIPVSGRLSDPQFDLSQVYSKAFQSVFTSIATAPFAFIGAVFGGGRGEELGYLEFDYGSSKISADSAKKLDILIRALHERPKLDLEISGYVDPGNDGNVLMKSLFLNRLKKEKIKDLAKPGSEGVSLENITLDGKEYEKYLQLAYLTEFSKDLQGKGGAKVSSLEKMEKELRAVTIVTGDDLALLAQRRAVAVKDYIIGTKKVNSKRIFLIKPKSLSPKKLEGVKDSRVILKLKPKT